MKKYCRKALRYINRVGINTWLLLLIIMMMLGDWSHVYFPRPWGVAWHIDAIAPFVYYASGIGAILIIIVIAVWISVKLRGK